MKTLFLSLEGVKVFSLSAWKWCVYAFMHEFVCVCVCERVKV